MNKHTSIYIDLKVSSIAREVYGAKCHLELIIAKLGRVHLQKILHNVNKLWSCLYVETAVDVSKDVHQEACIRCALFHLKQAQIIANNLSREDILSVLNGIILDLCDEIMKWRWETNETNTNGHASNN